MKQLSDSRNSNELIYFNHDELDRLVRGWSAYFDESYSYSTIGNLTKAGVNYTFPPAGNPRPHAPTSVGGNTYTYDPNGNLQTAEGREYVYDVENRLTQVKENGVEIRAFAYDGDGVLRTLSQSGTPKTRYVTPDYHIDIATGEPTVYYRFGGRAIAWRNNTTLRYLLADHLSSTHGEVGESQEDVAQRRYYPFGSDRPVSGASDLIRDERYTGQKRVDAGNGNARRELYHYGARAYLPGIGIFTQPDTVVPDYGNPQALNQYSYSFNNPMRYVDPTGHRPILDAGEGGPGDDTGAGVGWDPNWDDGAAGNNSWGSGSDGNGDIGPGSGDSQVTVVNTEPAGISASTPLADSTTIAMASGSPEPSGPLFTGHNGDPTQVTFARGLGVIVVHNAPGFIGDAVRALNGGEDNTVTLSSFLILSSTKVEHGSKLEAHELAHTEQALLLGPVFYLPDYLLGVAVTAAIHHTFDARTIHRYHPMEVYANQRAGLPLFLP